VFYNVKCITTKNSIILFLYVKVFINIGYNWLLVVSRKMSEQEQDINKDINKDNLLSNPHELLPFSDALMSVIMIIIIFVVGLFSMDTLSNLDKIKENWADYRCNPLFMPFASFFDANTKENFEFCMGNIFQMHSLPFLGSITSVFSEFTGLLSSIFNSISSLRNIIATLGGGINVIFQEFTERITMFFFKLRVSALHIKALFGRMYALLFSVMYMGMSGITGMTSFTNTFLFSFLDTFCFPGTTELTITDRVKVPIKNIKIGDVLMPGNSRVTATFQFYSKGQPMVQLGSVVVSTNHYVMYNGKAIKAGEHPFAIQVGPWDSDEVLYCLNTSTHTIPVKMLTFMDYDETPIGDKETMHFIEGRLNGEYTEKEYAFTEYGFAIGENVKIKTKSGLVSANDIMIGDKLSTGSVVAGIIHKEVNEICELPDMVITPSTLYWKDTKWIRYGENYLITKKKMELISFVVVPNSQIELENGIHVRDYMELCSPDAEMYYSKYLEKSCSN